MKTQKQWIIVERNDGMTSYTQLPVDDDVFEAVQAEDGHYEVV